MAEARRLNELASAVVDAADLPDGRLVVALSGGADSAALLWVCRRQDREVRAVHVHHGLAASDLMESAATAVAEAVGVDVVTARVTVTEGPSPEGQARDARYRALAAEARPGEWLLTGHTSDDQAETVLDRLLRGAGLDGLAGIPARRPPYARPFLAVSRSQTRELATLAALPWRDDPVNDEPGPKRNRIRRRLIPELEAEYNPRLRHSLATTAGLVAGEVELLEARLDLGVDIGPSGPEVAAAWLTTLPHPLAARLARRLLGAAGIAALSGSSVAAVLDVASGASGPQDVGGGVVVRRRGAMVVAATAREEPIPPQPLAAPGVTHFGPWAFSASVTRGPAAAPLAAGWMVADADTIGPLRVEPASGHPDMLGLLADSGVTAAERAAYPVVTGPVGPVWLPMVRRLSGQGWVAPSTRRYLVVRMDRGCHR